MSDEKRIKKVGLVVATCVTCVACRLAAGADGADKAAGYAKVREYVTAHDAYTNVLAAEGQFVAVANPAVVPWVAGKLDAETLREISRVMQQHLRIDLNAMGFAPAAARDVAGEKDDTNYDAIWVRDNVWIYHALAGDPARQADARRLLLALWDYYATPAQVARFEAVIANPALALDQMAVPHIRFDGASSRLDDVMVNGKPEVWNHRQIDAHGLFFAALGNALETGLLAADELTAPRMKVLSLYPRFLSQIRFHDYEDAGAWEELPRKNTSSIGIATRSLQVWRRLLYAGVRATMPVRDTFLQYLKDAAPEIVDAWSQDALQKLMDDGLATVKRQLALGGESPDYPPADPRFRRADAALLFLIEPMPLEGLSESELRLVITIVETLERPMGILRYRNDSYQAGNYWIAESAPPTDDRPTLTGDTSSEAAFLWRLSKLMPDTEAQWFFDSIMSLARLRLAQMTDDPGLRRQDLHFAALHLKRALGQITGDVIAADGQPVRPWQMPESIGTVVMAGGNHYLPSPITPLNWSKAALQMALTAHARALNVKKAVGNNGNRR